MMLPLVMGAWLFAQTPPPDKPKPSNDRLFGVLPNFLTVNDRGAVPPMTTKEKYADVARSSFDWVEYPWYATTAGISQWNGSERGYGFGVSGYAKRYASSFADGTIENFAVGAVFPSLLHQDPRYFRMGHGAILHRLGYSVTRVFVTRGDSGRAQFNFSEIAGAAVAAGASNLYHPRTDRGLGNTFATARTLVIYDAITTIAKEFWPDVARLLKHKHGG